MPDFEEKLHLLIPQVDAFLDLTPYNGEYSYIDGTHLDISSSEKLSKELAIWLDEREWNTPIK